MQTRGSANIFGLDISSYQTITNAETLFTTMPNYIYLRAYGTIHTAPDTEFFTRVALADEYNVPSGAYYFATPQTPITTDGGAECDSQMNQFCDALEQAYGVGKYGDLIPMLDVESWEAETKPMNAMTGDQLIDWIKRFRDGFFTRTGRRLGFYTNRNFVETQMLISSAKLTEISDMPLWLAEYDEWYPQNVPDTAAPANLGGWATYALWQYGVLADADQYGLSHGQNKVDHNRTTSVDLIKPCPPPTNIVGKQKAGNILEITFTPPAATDYLGSNLYIDGTWKKWIVKGTNSTTVDIASYSRGLHTFQIISEDNYSDFGRSEIKTINFVEDGTPMPKRTTGITSTSLSSFVIDAGAVYVNYGEVDERLLGATRGGNTFTIEAEMREMEIDGVRQSIKGTKRVINVVASITVNLLELTTENLALALTGSEIGSYTQEPSVTPTHDTIRRIREIGTMDYVTNIAVVGKVNNTSENFIGILYNALSSGGLELAMEDENEAAIELTFTAHIDAADIADDGSYPEAWEIRMPIIPAT